MAIPIPGIDRTDCTLPHRHSQAIAASAGKVSAAAIQRADDWFGKALLAAQSSEKCTPQIASATIGVSQSILLR